MAGLLRGFRRTLTNDRNLRRFVVEARPTGRQLGTGSYGSVEEVEVNGLTCAAKKIHEILLDVGNVGVQRIASMFVQECQLMSDLRHPNLTLFIGLCFVPDCQLPLLVMERLEGSIDNLLESVPDIPLALKRSMLEDVTRGLLYLHNHNPQIVHRDLTAKNVLHTSLLVAKITDLGNSRIVNLQPGQLAQTLSQNPGTLVYMPPEALTDTAHYGPSLDIFSFGHLFLFVGTQVFPGKLLEPTYADPENHRRLLGRSEYERRGTYVDQLKNKLPTGEHHPFVQLISRCLQNDPSDRPTAEQLVTAMVEMKAEVDGPYGDFTKLDALKQVATMRALKGRDSAVREKTAELAVKEMEIQQLHQELEQIQAEKVDAEAQYQRDLQQKNSELRQKEAELQRCSLLLQQKEAEKVDAEAQHQRDMRQKNSELHQTEEDFQRCILQLQQKEAELKQKNEQLQQREVELQQKNTELIKEDKILSLRAQEEERKRNLCKFRLFCHHPDDNELMEKRLEIHKDKTLRETVIEAHRLFELEGVVPVECCRLVRYDTYTETLDQSFDELLTLPTFGDHVGGARTYYSFELFLEIRGEGEEFRPYNKGGLNLKVLIIDLPEGSVREPILMRGEQTWKVQDLKTELAKRFGLNKATMNIALELFNNERIHLSNDDNILKSENFYRKHTIYVCSDREDYAKEFMLSEMYQVIDKHANEILLFISVPPPPPPRKAEQPKKVDDQSKDSIATTTDRTTLEAQSADIAMDVQAKEEGNETADAADVSAASMTVAEKEDDQRPLRKTIEVRIDRRCTLAELKTRLEEYVQVPSSEFKIYRNYSDNPEEYEMIRVHDSLKSVQNETKLVVRSARSLKDREVAVKLFLLEVTKHDFFRPIMVSIVAKGMTVRQFKEQVVEEAYEQGVDVNLNADRMRLRKKTWRSPCTIFLDSQVFDRDIHVFANFEIYIECLDEKVDSSQTQVYVRHWHPSTYTVDSTREIILSDNSPEHLKLKLSQLSGIPLDRVQFAKSKGSFPCEKSVLDIESELEWNPTVTTIRSMPLFIYDDGSILYFKDSEEQLAELTSEKRSVLQEQEKSRLGKYGPSSSSGSKRQLL